MVRGECDTRSDSVIKLGFHSALYHTCCLDEKLSPDISVSLLVLGHAMSACLPLVHSRMSRQGKGRSV